MKEYDYQFTDKVLTLMSKKFIKLFLKARNLANFDELNIISFSTNLYEELKQVVDNYFLLIAKETAETVGGNEKDITLDWLLDFLEEYDTVTEYVFLHEVERKKQRFQESLVGTQDRNKAINKALSLWDRMVRQYGIEITDRIALDEYKKNGVTKVQWITNNDGRECEVCKGRHKKIYEINKVPSKPHINCRCRFKPIV